MLGVVATINALHDRHGRVDHDAINQLCGAFGLNQGPVSEYARDKRGKRMSD